MPVSSWSQSTPSAARRSAEAGAPSTLTCSGTQSRAPPGSGTAVGAPRLISRRSTSPAGSTSTRSRGIAAQFGRHAGASSSSARSCSIIASSGKSAAAGGAGAASSRPAIAAVTPAARVSGKLARGKTGRSRRSTSAASSTTRSTANTPFSHGGASTSQSVCPLSTGPRQRSSTVRQLHVGSPGPVVMRALGSGAQLDA